MDIKRGSFRIWVVASIAWMIFAFLYFDMGHEIQYAYQYTFQYDNLVASANSRDAREWSDSVASVLRTDPTSLPRDPIKPDYDWFWILVLPQTAGLAVVLTVSFLAAIIAKRIYSWIVDGFKE